MKELLKKLINAPSTLEKGEVETAMIAAEFLRKHNVQCQVDEWAPNRANLIAKIPSKREKKPLLFVGHLDVVPEGQGNWKTPPYKATESEGKIFGRGAADMKAGLASVLHTAAWISDNNIELTGDLIIAATAGEETDSCGIKRFVEKNIPQFSPLEAVIIPEPTDLEIMTAHRGFLWVEITTIGKTAHGSMPQLGINAIESMTKFLKELKSLPIDSVIDPVLGSGSLSINKINGGNAANVIPDKCSVQIDIRMVPGLEYTDIISNIEKIFEKIRSDDNNFQASLKVIRQVPPLFTDPNCDFVCRIKDVLAKSGTKTVGFTTDAPFLAKLGSPVIILGPGSPGMCHQPDEFVEITQMDKAFEYYKKIVIEMLT